MESSELLSKMQEYRLRIVNRTEFDVYVPVFASSVEHAYRRLDEIFMTMHYDSTLFGYYPQLGELGARYEDAAAVELIDADSGAVLASLQIGL